MPLPPHIKKKYPESRVVDMGRGKRVRVHFRRASASDFPKSQRSKFSRNAPRLVVYAGEHSGISGVAKKGKQPPKRRVTRTDKSRIVRALLKDREGHMVEYEVEE
jgi:hypothetical protein